MEDGQSNGAMEQWHENELSENTVYDKNLKCVCVYTNYMVVQKIRFKEIVFVEL